MSNTKTNKMYLNLTAETSDCGVQNTTCLLIYLFEAVIKPANDSLHLYFPTLYK